MEHKSFIPKNLIRLINFIVEIPKNLHLKNYIIFILV
jgi:hypothetical protein